MKGLRYMALPSGADTIVRCSKSALPVSLVDTLGVVWGLRGGLLLFAFLIVVVRAYAMVLVAIVTKFGKG